MADNSEFIPDSGYDKRTSFILDIFWLGFIIYSASFTISTTIAVNFKVCQVLQILGILLFVPAAIMLIQWKFDNFYLKTIYSIYCFWLLIVIFRGFAFTYERLKFMLFDAEFGLFLYLVPLILLFPKNLKYYKKIFIVIIILGSLFIVYDIIFRDNLLNLDYRNISTKFTFEYFTKSLSFPSGFLLLTYLYHSNRKKLFALLVIFISVTFALIRARRALLFVSAIPLVISYMLYMYTDKKKILIILFSIFFGSLLILSAIKVYNRNKDTSFSLISKRISEDTRSGVEKAFYRDMTTRDWIIGKGFYGLYYCPGIDINGFTGYRGVIETDYLNIILKGGIISLGLLLLIAIPAMIKGIFYSKNLLAKAAGFWIFIWLISLYPTIVNTFTLNHLLLWISIGICYSKELRNTPEITIKRIFSS
jgi:hypothetical protein